MIIFTPERAEKLAAAMRRSGHTVRYLTRDLPPIGFRGTGDLIIAIRPYARVLRKGILVSTINWESIDAASVAL